MFKFLKDFFNLTNSELKGAIVLLFCIIAIFLIPKIYFHFEKAENIKNDVAFEKWIVALEHKDSIAELENAKNNSENKASKSLFIFDPNTVSYDQMLKLGIDGKTANILLKFRAKGAKFYAKKDLLKVYGFSELMYNRLQDYIVFSEKYNKNKEEKTVSKKEAELFPFDPNTVTYQEMIRLGIDGKIANILIKYRDKGAQFRTKEDVLKIYGFSESMYSRLEAFVIFPDVEKILLKPDSINTIPSLYIVDVNKADTADFIQLKGIGAYYAKEIIAYRNKLGGFYKIEQLKEVYGISEELYTSLEFNLVLENSEIRKIDINHTSFKELIRHPYIDKELTIKILDLHKDIGGFLKIEDLKTYQTLNDKEFEVLKNYLEVKKN